MTSLTADQAVQNGIAWLDENIPNWRKNVNPDTVDQISTTHCVQSQAAQLDYNTACAKYSIYLSHRCEMGFTCRQNSAYSYDDLTQAWRTALAAAANTSKKQKKAKPAKIRFNVTVNDVPMPQPMTAKQIATYTTSTGLAVLIRGVAE